MAESTKKILVVDDEPDVASLLTLMLKSQGYSVITAGDGQEALERARAEVPDLIVLDIMLPRMDGYKVARILKFDEFPPCVIHNKIQKRSKEVYS